MNVCSSIRGVVCRFALFILPLTCISWEISAAEHDNVSRLSDFDEIAFEPVLIINQFDTVIFDFSQALCTSGLIQVPVSISSDDQVYALDFELKFNPSQFTYNSLINHQPYLNNAANFHATDSTLRFTTFSMTPIGNNTPLISLRFNVPSGMLSLSSFITIRTWLNGDNSSYRAINLQPASPIIPNGPTVMMAGDSVQLSVTLPSGYSNVWSNGSSASFIYVTLPGTYSVVFTNPNGCTTTNSIIISWSNPLPVEWLGFNAKEQEGSVLLTWSTASEIGCDYFCPEHSLDGTTWRPIGVVDGAGNSSTNKFYQFTDQQAVNGYNYYRIRQVDYDGDFSFSPMVVVHTDQRNADELVQFFPNPWNHESGNLILRSACIQSITEAVAYSLDGRITVKLTCRETGFSGNYCLTEVTGTEKLPAGIYTVHLNDGFGFKPVKLVIQ